MSRLTATQVITQGHYLEPDFDPASLTISQLLGVLGYHNIQYPTPYSKAKLVNVFNDEIKTRANKFKKERLKRNNSQPSDDGITDGVTGRPLTTQIPQPTPRRSSRRLSKAPADADDEEEPAPRPEPPKRRRSSAQPSLGGPSRRKSPTRIQPALYEQSEPEDEEVQPPPRKLVKKKTSQASSSRRKSEAFGGDSGWEDNNIFQSGAESSSPAPSRVRAPRKSGIPRRSRQSMSAPPDASPTRDQSPFKPPQTTFSPRFERPPPLMFPSPLQRPKTLPASPMHFAFEDIEVDVKGGQTEDEEPVVKEEEPEEVVEEVEAKEESPTAFSDLESKSSEGIQPVASNEPVVVQASAGPSTIIRALSLLALVLIGTTLWSYKTRSAAIGFCDTNSQTNSALEAARAYRIAVEACNRENRTTLYPASDLDLAAAPCPLPPLIPLPYADSCTPCPGHATCTQFSVRCANGYLLKPPALLAFLPAPPNAYNLSMASSSTPSEIIWSALGTGLNGLPGFGSIALPPRCMLDPRRQQNIGALGKAMKAILAQERGRRLCVGGKNLELEYTEEQGGQSRKWGVELETLRENMKRKTSARLKPAFNETFNDAVDELIEWGGVLLGVDRQGRRYLASTEPDLTWDCAITVKLRELWAAWRQTALGVVVALAVILLTRLRHLQKKSESRRVAELVQIALDALRNQELAHHTDPVTAPYPYLSSIQLRDVILQNEHSIPTRRRLWDQVEHVVEGNANVRANLEEIEGGDELRVWRWVGSTGRGLI